MSEETVWQGLAAILPIFHWTVLVLDLLSRRYDVVAANPPYMGSKNLGPRLKNHVERNFKAGKRAGSTQLSFFAVFSWQSIAAGSRW